MSAGEERTKEYSKQNINDLWYGYLLLFRNGEVDLEVNAKVHELYTNWNKIRLAISEEKEALEKKGMPFSDQEKELQLVDAGNQFGSYVSKLIVQALI